jgi:ATP-dependent Lhr-like helicase
VLAEATALVDEATEGEESFTGQLGLEAIAPPPPQERRREARPRRARFARQRTG